MDILSEVKDLKYQLEELSYLKEFKAEWTEFQTELRTQGANFEYKITQVETHNYKLKEQFNKILETMGETDYLNKRIDDNHKEIQWIKQELRGKSDIQDLDGILIQLEKCVKAADLNNIQLKLKQCVKKYEIDNINEEIKGLQEQKERYITKNQLELSKLQVIEEISKSLKNFVYIEQLQSELGKIYRSFNDIKEREKTRKSQIEKVLAVLKKGINDNKKAIEANPWMPEIVKLDNKINTKCSIVEMKNHFIQQQQLNNSIDQKVTQFEQKVAIFQEVQERFDEIICDKCSKLDLDKLQEIVDTHLEANEFNLFRDKASAKIYKISNILKKTSKLSKESKLKIEQLKQTMELRQKQTHNIAEIYNRLDEVMHNLSSKADKADVLNAIDNFVQKDEVTPLKNSQTEFQSQLLNSAILLKETVKSLLKVNKSSTNPNKARLQLYRNVSNLIEKINCQLDLQQLRFLKFQSNTPIINNQSPRQDSSRPSSELPKLLNTSYMTGRQKLNTSQRVKHERYSS